MSKNLFLDDISTETNEEIASRLKFIGKIQKDEKINVRYVNRQPNNWLTSFSRSIIYPDNRINALKFVRDIISRTFEIIEQNIRKENYATCKIIISDLIKCQQGLINLKSTYMDDTKFGCDIDVLIERIIAKLFVLKKDYKDLFENEEKEEF